MLQSILKDYASILVQWICKSLRCGPKRRTHMMYTNSRTKRMQMVRKSLKKQPDEILGYCPFCGRDLISDYCDICQRECPVDTFDYGER
jgi:hypothetical protein